MSAKEHPSSTTSGYHFDATTPNATPLDQTPTFAQETPRQDDSQWTKAGLVDFTQKQQGYMAWCDDPVPDEFKGKNTYSITTRDRVGSRWKDWVSASEQREKRWEEEAFQDSLGEILKRKPTWFEELYLTNALAQSAYDFGDPPPSRPTAEQLREIWAPYKQEATEGSEDNDAATALDRSDDLTPTVPRNPFESGEPRNTGDTDDEDAQEDPYEVGHSDDDEPGEHPEHLEIYDVGDDDDNPDGLGGPLERMTEEKREAEGWGGLLE